MFVNIQDAWKRNVRVFGSSLHLIHFNDMWRRARATQNFQTVGTSRDREQIPGRQFALFPLWKPPSSLNFFHHKIELFFSSADITFRNDCQRICLCSLLGFKSRDSSIQ